MVASLNSSFGITMRSSFREIMSVRLGPVELVSRICPEGRLKRRIGLAQALSRFLTARERVSS